MHFSISISLYRAQNLRPWFGCTTVKMLLQPSRDSSFSPQTPDTAGGSCAHIAASHHGVLIWFPLSNNTFHMFYFGTDRTQTLAVL